MVTKSRGGAGAAERLARWREPARARGANTHHLALIITCSDTCPSSACSPVRSLGNSITLVLLTMAATGEKAAASSLAKLAITDLEFKDKRVLMRCDFNVPLNTEGEITNTQRVDAALPSIKHVLKEGAKSLVLCSHLGRPGGRPSSKLTLKPVAELLKKLLDE